MQHGERKHALYGGSSISRIMKCPASAKLAATVPQMPSSRWALEGTAAHELLDLCLTNKCFDATLGTAMYGYNGEIFDTPDKVDELIEGVQTVLDYVLGLLECFDDAVLYVEHPFNLKSTDPENTWGTCDIVVYVQSLSLMYVIDFKYGAGVAVEVEDNKQLLYYGLGAQQSGLEAENVVLAVIQPRCYHRDGPVRPWPTTGGRVRDYLTEVNNAIIAAQQPTAAFVPDEQTCRWCPAKPACPAIEARALQTIKQTFATVRDVRGQALPDVKSVAPARLSEILQAKKMITDWLDEVEEYARSYAISGGDVFGFKLVEGRGKRHWPDDPQGQIESAQMLMRLIGTENWDDVYPRKLITVTEADKRVRAAFKGRAGNMTAKQASEEAGKALAAITRKESSGKLALVPITDSRPAVDRAGQAFASVQVLPPTQQG